jgi:hypothetical protein
MRQRTALILGAATGFLYGLYLILFVPSEKIPAFIGMCVGGLGKLFLTGAPEGPVLFLVLLGVPLFCAAFGTALGYALAFIFRVVRKPKKHENL